MRPADSGAGMDSDVDSGRAAAGGCEVTCFRKEVTLEGAPDHAVVWISEDLHYRLYINSRLVARGLADPGKDYPGGKSETTSGLYFADGMELALFLHAGINDFTVEVFSRRITV